ncbi:MAG: amidohydrolase family protein [Polyangia bacterium]
MRAQPLTQISLLAALSLGTVVAVGSLSGCRSRQQAAVPSKAASQGAVTQPAVKPPFRRKDLPRIDVHTHIQLGAGLRAARLLESYGIVHAVNLSGPPPEAGLTDAVGDAEVAYHRLTVFANLPWYYAAVPEYGPRIAAELPKIKAAGARGIKIAKGLGLGIRGPDGKLLRVDDPGLDVVFDTAGELGLPIAIHVGDPQAFWREPDEKNERYEELMAHPDWSFWADHQKGTVPSWRELFDAFSRRVLRHPKTTFIGVHFGNAPEEPQLVAQLLDRAPNLYIDTAARLPEIGRSDPNHSPEKLRAFFLKYQDRILFGTDTGIGRKESALMFGSTGQTPPTQADADRFFESTWRYFETSDTDIPSPTPIQGRWTISGVNLPDAVLEKIYYKNAQRLLGITLAEKALPKQEKGPVPSADDL